MRSPSIRNVGFGVLFGLGGAVLFAVMLLAAGASSNCSEKFHEVRMMEIIQLLWTGFAVVLISYFASGMRSKSDKREAFLLDLLVHSLSALSGTCEALDDYISSRSEPDQRKVLRSFKELGRSLTMLGKFDFTCVDIDCDEAKRKLLKIISAHGDYKFAATETPFGQTTVPYSDEIQAEISESHLVLQGEILDLRMLLLVS